MLPHQQRVVDEKVELDDRISKLSNFTQNEIFLSLEVGEQVRLYLQLKLMQLYSSVLHERIANFK